MKKKIHRVSSKKRFVPLLFVAWLGRALRTRSAAHLARAADDVGAALAALLAAFEADEAPNQSNETIASCSSSAETTCLVLVFMLFAHGRGGAQSIHLDGLAGLRRSGLIWFGLGFHIAGFGV